MIVKIQQSLSSTSPVKSMLIYNESRRIFYEAPLTTEVAELLDGREKAYFEARVTPVTKKLEILKETESQNW